MKLRPVHFAVLGYLEWHTDRGLPFHSIVRMARDLARNLTDVQRATRDLVSLGAVSFEHYSCNERFVARLWDGRMTPSLAQLAKPPDIHALHRGRGHYSFATMRRTQAERIAA